MASLKQLADSLEAINLFNKKLSVFVFVVLALILGGLSSANTADDGWYQGLIKSDLNPPGYVFGIVWPILYILMSISAYRAFDSIARLFFIQLFFNTIWSWLFFFYYLPFVALLDTWLLIFLNIKIILTLTKEDRLSAVLYLPSVSYTHLTLPTKRIV